MKDLRKMIEALNKQISWEQEELGKADWYMDKLMELEAMKND